VVIQNNSKGKTIARVHFREPKDKTIELSATAGILLCLETGEEILVNSELFKDQSFFRNKLDDKKMLTDFEKMFLDIVDATGNSDIFSSKKDPIQ